MTAFASHLGANALLILPVFAPIILGMVLKRIAFLPDEFWSQLERLVFFRDDASPHYLRDIDEFIAGPCSWPPHAGIVCRGFGGMRDSLHNQTGGVISQSRFRTNFPRMHPAECDHGARNGIRGIRRGRYGNRHPHRCGLGDTWLGSCNGRFPNVGRRSAGRLACNCGKDCPQSDVDCGGYRLDVERLGCRRVPEDDAFAGYDWQGRHRPGAACHGSRARAVSFHSGS